MLVYPAIDILGGKCVRLLQGKYENQTIYWDSPAEMASRFVSAGLTFVHVVDLDGAKNGCIANWKALGEILSLEGITAQVGGGIRDAEDVRQLLALGAIRLIIGSLAVKSPNSTQELLNKFGPDRIVISLDIKNGRIAYSGWTKSDEMNTETFVGQMKALGARKFICTDVSKDGMLQGPNVKLYADLMRRFPDVEVIASGGVTSLHDLHELARVGVAGVVVGKALYEHHIQLEDLARLVKSYETRSSRDSSDAGVTSC